MQAVQNGGYLNPNRSVQISEGLEASAKRFYYYEEWGLPEGAQDQLNQGDVTILLPSDTAFRARRMLGRFAWPREAPYHINPRAPFAGGAELRFRAI